MLATAERARETVLAERAAALDRRADVIALNALASSMASPPPGGSALDVRCRAGGAAVGLAHAVGPHGTVIGLDLSVAMLEQAERNSGGPLRFWQGAATDLPFPAEEFDLARCGFVLSEAADPDRVVSELVRVTRPGGQLLVLDVDWQSLSVDLGDDLLVEAVLGIVPGKGRRPRAGFEARRRLVEAGCEAVRVAPYVFTETGLAGAAELLSVLDVNLPEAESHVPARLREPWFRALERADASGGLLVSVTTWVTAARKPG